MADVTTTTPPAVANPTEDGRVDTGGRQAWIWCQDATTGHRYDVHTTRLPVPGVNPVPGYRINYKRLARPGKARPVWEADPSELNIMPPGAAAAGEKRNRGAN